MSLRLDPNEPENMTPDERLDEVSNIFARGALRLHGRNLIAPREDQEHSDSSPIALELPASLGPDVVAG
jgi:hypothetical protein